MAVTEAAYTQVVSTFVTSRQFQAFFWEGIFLEYYGFVSVLDEKQVVVNKGGVNHTPLPCGHLPYLRGGVNSQQEAALMIK